MATRTRKKVWERLSLSALNYNTLKYKCLSILKADRRSERWQNIDINTPILVNYLYRSIPRKSGYLHEVRLYISGIPCLPLLL